MKCRRCNEPVGRIFVKGAGQFVGEPGDYCINGEYLNKTSIECRFEPPIGRREKFELSLPRFEGDLPNAYCRKAKWQNPALIHQRTRRWAKFIRTRDDAQPRVCIKQMSHRRGALPNPRVARPHPSP